MKRSDVLQLGVILIGIIIGLMTLDTIFNSLYGVFVLLTGGRYDSEYMFTPMLTFFAVSGLKALTCWLLITRSRGISDWIYERSGLKSGFSISSQPNDLLFIILVAIGIYLLITNIIPLISALISSFKAAGSRHGYEALQGSPHAKWMELILNILLPLILLMAARPIADYFARNLSEEPVKIEEEESLI